MRPDHDLPADTAPRMDEGRRRLIAWLWRLPVLATLAGGGYGVYLAVKVHFLKRAAGAAPEFADRPETSIAPLRAFAEPWDAVAFDLAAEPGDGHPLPALAVRLPGPIPGGLDVDSGVGVSSVHLAAFSRICTHQFCVVTLNRDVQAINFAFNHATDQPALTCACHLSVFDPMRGGQAVSGPAVDPLPRVRLELRGERVVATGLERTNG